MALLLALFIVVPIVELYVIIKVGGLIGVLPTLAVLLATAVLGSLLLGQQGRDAWRRFNANISARRFPGREVADGLMIAIGGALLLTPGFITDIFGLVLLIPASRAVVRRLMRSYFARRFMVIGGAGLGGTGDGMPPRSQPHRDYDFEGTAEEADRDEPHLPPS